VHVNTEENKMFVVVIFNQNLKICFQMAFLLRRLGLNILYHFPVTVSLLWTKDGEEVR